MGIKYHIKYFTRIVLAFAGVFFFFKFWEQSNFICCIQAKFQFFHNIYCGKMKLFLSHGPNFHFGSFDCLLKKYFEFYLSSAKIFRKLALYGGVVPGWLKSFITMWMYVSRKAYCVSIFYFNNATYDIQVWCLTTCHSFDKFAD